MVALQLRGLQQQGQAIEAGKSGTQIICYEK